MGKQTILKRGIEAVTFLFAIFGGFLTNIAPPEEANSRFAIGISSFLALIVLMLITALVKKPLKAKAKRRWLVVAVVLFAVSLGSALFYVWNLDKLTFAYPPESTKAEYVGGTTLTPDAQSYKNEHQAKTISEIVADFGGMENRELVWPPEAVRSAKLILMINYILLVLSLAGCIFCFTESLLS